MSPQLTALIHLSLHFLVSSSYSLPQSVMILGIRSNPRPLFLPLLDPHPNTMHKTIVNSPTFPHTSFSFQSLCLLSRDTNMLASNRCQAKGHVGEKQEYGTCCSFSISLFILSCLSVLYSQTVYLSGLLWF